MAAMNILLAYLLVINIISFITLGLDKWKAEWNSSFRIPEKILWLLTLLGGSIGTLLAMNFFRHKTKKLPFQTVVAVILVVQMLIIVFILKKFG